MNAAATPEWPKRADGSNMTIGEMSPEDRRAQVAASTARVMSGMARKGPDYGDIQIGDAAEYDGLGEGFVVEEYGVHGWAIPDWVERSQPHLEGVFSSRAAAEAAIAS
jgi:hypothetical protein